MSKKHAEAPATWFRLSAENRAKVVEEYRNGATAAAIGKKWRVSAGSVYRWVGAAGASKKANSDAAAQAHAEGVERAAAAAEAEAARVADGGAEALEGAAVAGLADGEDDDDRPLDVGGSARRAVRRAARLLEAGRVADAERMLKAAEALNRVAAETPLRQDSDWLSLLSLALVDPQFRVGLFDIDPDDPNPDPVKVAYWEAHRAAYRDEYHFHQCVLFGGEFKPHKGQMPPPDGWHAARRRWANGQPHGVTPAPDGTPEWAPE